MWKMVSQKNVQSHMGIKSGGWWLIGKSWPSCDHICKWEQKLWYVLMVTRKVDIRVWPEGH